MLKLVEKWPTVIYSFVCDSCLLLYFRQYLEENQGKGGAGVITSEALQPIYELKHVAERSSKSSEEVLTKLSMVSNVPYNG